MCAPALNAKAVDYSCTGDLKWTKKSLKLQEGQHLRRNSQNSNEENGRSSQFLLVHECISVFQVIRCLKVGTYLSNKGITYLLYLAC